MPARLQAAERKQARIQALKNNLEVRFISLSSRPPLTTLLSLPSPPPFPPVSHSTSLPALPFNPWIPLLIPPHSSPRPLSHLRLPLIGNELISCNNAMSNTRVTIIGISYDIKFRFPKSNFMLKPTKDSLPLPNHQHSFSCPFPSF